MDLSLVGAAGFTLIAAVFILGGRYIILDSLSEHYCTCSHEYNQHNIVPEGRGYALKEYSDGRCRYCHCKEYKFNEKDKRNSPPIKLFP